MGSGRTLLKNATVWSWISGPETGHCSGEALPGKEIVIERGRITIIRNNTDSVTNYNDFDLVVDLNHRLVLPGLIGKYSGSLECVVHEMSTNRQLSFAHSL